MKEDGANHQMKHDTSAYCEMEAFTGIDQLTACFNQYVLDHIFPGSIRQYLSKIKLSCGRKY